MHALKSHSFAFLFLDFDAIGGAASIQSSSVVLIPPLVCGVTVEGISIAHHV